MDAHAHKPCTTCMTRSTSLHACMGCRETSILRIDKVKGCMFVNQYLVVKFLGRGACGKVFLCLNTHDLRLYAMKVRGALQHAPCTLLRVSHACAACFTHALGHMVALQCHVSASVLRYVDAGCAQS
jgi:sigma54-dependent transcription regulator